MASNMSVSLGDHFIDFAERQVASGRYGSTSEVVHAGLQLLESHEAALERLRDAIQEGIDSGPPEPFDFAEFLEEMHRETAER